MTRTEVSNLSMGVYSSLGMLLDEGKSVFQWDARSHESEVTPMVEPVTTDVWQVSEDRVMISGKYAGGMETLEEASDTFESEWEINDASTMTGGLRLKTLQLYVDMGENVASASWGLKDDMGLMFYAIADSISDENGVAGKTGGPGDISSGNMQVLLGNLLLRDNILNKSIEGDVRSSGSGEVFADFTEEELEGFFADTIGCEFTDEERGFFEKTENGGYRLRYYLGNYGERRLENAGEIRSLGDGIVELTGTYFDPVPDVNEQHRHLTMRLRPNENSLFDGYVLESIHFE